MDGGQLLATSRGSRWASPWPAPQLWEGDAQAALPPGGSKFPGLASPTCLSVHLLFSPRKTLVTGFRSTHMIQGDVTASSLIINPSQIRLCSHFQALRHGPVFPGAQVSHCPRRGVRSPLPRRRAPPWLGTSMGKGVQGPLAQSSFLRMPWFHHAPRAHPAPCFPTRSFGSPASPRAFRFPSDSQALTGAGQPGTVDLGSGVLGPVTWGPVGWGWQKHVTLKGSPGLLLEGVESTPLAGEGGAV